MKIKGTFISYWDDGSTVSCGSTLDDETGGIIDLEHMDAGVEDRGGLVKEEFEDADGNTYAICDCCHCHIMKSVMVEDPQIPTVLMVEDPQIPTVLNETLVCSYNACDSHFDDDDFDDHYDDCRDMEDEDEDEDED